MTPFTFIGLKKLGFPSKIILVENSKSTQPTRSQHDSISSNLTFNSMTSSLRWCLSTIFPRYFPSFYSFQFPSLLQHLLIFFPTFRISRTKYSSLFGTTCARFSYTPWAIQIRAEQSPKLTEFISSIPIYTQISRTRNIR
jgi:hypothetical protein